MAFFQNVFTADFEGNWVLGDRHASPKFVVPRNHGRGDELVTVYAEGPYNLAGNDAEGDAKNILNIEFSVNDFKNWISLPVTISATSLAATTPSEIAVSLQANELFNSFFSVHFNMFPISGSQRLVIKQKKPATSMRFYIKNNQAETVLKFNEKSGIAEIPDYFLRHTIANRFNFEDAQNILIELDPSNLIDANLINNAKDFRGNDLNLDSSDSRADYVFLEGRSGLFIFTKQTVSGGNIVEKIEYHAGAKVGDFAKKTTYADFEGSIAQAITEEPYVLTESDLIVPA